MGLGVSFGGAAAVSCCCCCDEGGESAGRVPSPWPSSTATSLPRPSRLHGAACLSSSSRGTWFARLGGYGCCLQ